VGDTEDPPKCLARVRLQMLVPQWHIRGEARSRLKCGLEVLHVSLHGLRDLCMTRLGMLALNGYGSRVIDILIGSVGNICWCIVGSQAIWWEGMLALDLHKIGDARTSQCFVEAMPSNVILMMPKNQESSKFQRFKNEVFKNQVSRIIKIKIKDSRFKNQEKNQSR